MALLDSHARLQLLAKVHELLTTKADGAQTVLMPGLLETLADGLRQSFAKTAAQVTLQLTSDPIALPVDQAIPLALLANELVTNAYKHAFPNDSSGRDHREPAAPVRGWPDLAGRRYRYRSVPDWQ